MGRGEGARRPLESRGALDEDVTGRHERGDLPSEVGGRPVLDVVLVRGPAQDAIYVDGRLTQQEQPVDAQDIIEIQRQHPHALMRLTEYWIDDEWFNTVVYPSGTYPAALEEVRLALPD